MLKSYSLAKWGAAALLVSALSSCDDILEQYFPKKNTPTFPSLGQDIPFYALSGGTRLDAYSTTSPSTRTGSVAITGLQSGEKLLAMDFRPATGQLYGVGSTSRIYVINQNTGVARAIGAGPFTPAVAGNLVGFDFNPTVDRIRLVTNTGQNLRLNPETGTVAATDGSLNGAAGASITGAAYTNNTAEASTTALYAINTQNQQLYLVNPPNEGTLVPVGALNLNISGDGGFDIDAKTGTALGLYMVQGKPTLFSVDLGTGAARPLAEYAASSGYSGIAIPTQPVAYSVSDVFFSSTEIANFLGVFDPTQPSIGTSKIMTGIPRTETIVGLDFRPANGQLYALTRSSQTNGGNGLYTVNAATGAATLVGRLSISVEGDRLDYLDVDFNPVADRLRIITSTGQNLRVNPNDATVIEDGRINPSSARIGSAAYSNNFSGATSTTLYDIDPVAGILYRQEPPNAGTLVRVGSLGIPSQDPIFATVQLGSNFFDIGGTTNTGYTILNLGSTPTGGTNNKLFTVDLATGAATPTNNTRNFAAINGFTVGLGF